MEHRCGQRVTATLKLFIYKRAVPVAVGWVRDLSRKGLFIETDFRDVNLHQPLELEFVTRSKSGVKRLCVLTQVVRKGNGGLAVEIDADHAASVTAMNGLMNRYRPQVTYTAARQAIA